MRPVIDKAGDPSTVQQSIPSNASSLVIKRFIEFAREGGSDCLSALR